MDKKFSNPDAQLFAAAESGAFLASPWVRATDEIIVGMKRMQVKADQLANVGVEFKQGNLFEYIEAAKFNADAAFKGSDVEAVVTDAIGQPHSPVDILLQKAGETIEEVQAKSYTNQHAAIQQLLEPKYDDMTKLVPSDTFRDLQNLLGDKINNSSSTEMGEQYQKISNTITDRLNTHGVHSPGTSIEETFQAAKMPNEYAANLEASYCGDEIIHTAASSMIAGAIIGGGVAALKNYYKYKAGELTETEATSKTVASSIKRAAFGGTAGALGSGIRVVSEGTLAPYASIAVASSLISISSIAYSYATGKIPARDAMHQMGATGVGCVSGIYGGAIFGALVGSGGAVVGSIAGYMMARLCYQGCLSIFKETHLSEDETRRISVFCHESQRLMKELRSKIKEEIFAIKKDRAEAHTALFHNLDIATETDDILLACDALASYALSLGKELQFSGFDEFDEFMRTDNNKLII